MGATFFMGGSSTQNVFDVRRLPHSYIEVVYIRKRFNLPLCSYYDSKKRVGNIANAKGSAGYQGNQLPEMKRREFASETVNTE